MCIELSCAILISVKKLFTIGMIFLCGSLLWGQDASSGDGGSFGVVIYADGEVVSIIRDGRRFEYDAFTGELLGMPIYGGDIIQTDPKLLAGGGLNWR